MTISLGASSLRRPRSTSAPRNHVFSPFCQEFTQKEIRINIIGEITKARDFDVDNLYIKYKFVLPKKKGEWMEDPDVREANKWVHDYEDIKDSSHMRDRSGITQK